MTGMGTQRLRVAIASPGVGRVQRGFERLFADLFDLMRDEHDMVLLKGGGPVSAAEKVPLFLHRNGLAVRVLPVHRLFRRTPLHTECMLFALGMLPYIRRGAFDVIHTIDAPLTRILFHMRARLGLRFTLLYTEGTGMPPSDYPPADHTHQVAQVLMERAVASGRRPEAMTMLPCGFYPERFIGRGDRAVLREAHGIAPDTLVVLSVAALNRTQKRIDYLIDEMAVVDGDWLLLLDGSTDHGDPGLAEYARAKLGARVRVSQVASGKVRDLYEIADVLAHVSMSESFGLAIVEAASSGLAVITHDGPHFRWLIGNPACWIDASCPGALAAKIRLILSDRSQLAAMRSATATAERFSWHHLKPGYAGLYRHVADLGPRPASPSGFRRVA